MAESFGLSAYRPGQKQAVEALLKGRDLFCLMPTGAGKSLCYQLPALVHGGLTLVISPLIALMQDQVEHLRRRGIAAAMLSSADSPRQREATIRQLQAGEITLLYAAPERLMTPAFLALMQTMPPWLLVVDEAHCIAKWGADFRPAYLSIGSFVQNLPRRPVLCAFTATADRSIRRAILESLGLKHPARVTLDLRRENLNWIVRPTLHPDQALQVWIRNHLRDKGIIYCGTRRETERLAQLLRQQGYQAAAYHAGLSPEKRAELQERFASGGLRILTATVAFGMGVDIPDIRYVVHTGLPADIADYAQETGRAGRDRQPADCLLLLNPAATARKRLQQRLRKKDADPSVPRSGFFRQLRQERADQALIKLLVSGRCIQQGIAASFGQHYPPCGRCSACLAGHRPLAPVPRLKHMTEGDLIHWWDQLATAWLAGQGTASREALQHAYETIRLAIREPDQEGAP